MDAVALIVAAIACAAIVGWLFVAVDQIVQVIERDARRYRE